MNTKITIFIIVLFILIAIGIGFKMTGNTITGEIVNNQIINENTENQMSIKEPTKVKLQTNVGDIILELSKDMPITTGNFEKLVKEKFYDGVIFHRVIEGFMIQGGDPAGTGMGGPGYTIKDEFTDNNQNNKGTISMANAGPNTGGSQFFINLVDNNFLDSKHPVFGKVIEGIDVIDKIGKTETGPGDKPLQEIKIIKAEVI